MTTHVPAVRDAVAGEVRAAAARQRVSEASIARHLGMSQSKLSRRWTGQLPFDIEELAAIAAYLDIPMTDLIPPQAAPTGDSRIRCYMNGALQDSPSVAA